MIKGKRWEHLVPKSVAALDLKKRKETFH